MTVIGICTYYKSLIGCLPVEISAKTGKNVDAFVHSVTIFLSIM